jgi:hypothetical protein
MQIYYIIFICAGVIGVILLMYNLYKLYQEHKANEKLAKVLEFIIIDSVNEDTRKRSPHEV